MKIAHITTIDLSLRYLLLNQLCRLGDAGYEVTGISTPGPDVPAVEAAGIRHIAVPMTRSLSPFSDLASLARLVRIMRRERFAIVHTHNPKPGLLGQLAARMARVPIVVNTLHGFYFHDGMSPFWRRFYIQMEKIAAICSDAILSQNREDIKTAIREGICRPDQIRWLGNGIDVQRFDPGRIDAASVEAARSGLSIPARCPVVGFVGRLVAEKGVLELMAAAQRVRATVPDVRFLFAGVMDGDKADAISPQTARDYGIADACVFAGWREDVEVLYAMMDLFVLPSHREGFPRAPMEASAMGIPSVVTDIRGCREAVRHGKNGLLTPPGDEAALAEAITTLLCDRKLARTMGDKGRNMALELFDERHVFQRVLDTYARLRAMKGL